MAHCHDRGPMRSDGGVGTRLVSGLSDGLAMRMRIVGSPCRLPSLPFHAPVTPPASIAVCHAAVHPSSRSRAAVARDTAAAVDTAAARVAATRETAPHALLMATHVVPPLRRFACRCGTAPAALSADCVADAIAAVAAARMAAFAADSSAAAASASAVATDTDAASRSSSDSSCLHSGSTSDAARVRGRR